MNEKNNNKIRVKFKEGTYLINPVEDYDILKNKPKINGTELKGDLTSEELSLQSEMGAISNLEIEKILSL